MDCNFNQSFSSNPHSVSIGQERKKKGVKYAADYIRDVVSIFVSQGVNAGSLFIIISPDKINHVYCNTREVCRVQKEEYAPAIPIPDIVFAT